VPFFTVALGSPLVAVMHPDTTPGCGPNGSMITCTFVPLAAGQSKTFRVVAWVPCGSTQPGAVTSHAGVAPSMDDPNPNNNSISATTTIKHAGPDDPPSGPECGCEGASEADLGISSSETESSERGTVHLNSGRFALELPGLAIPGIEASSSFSLTHLSNVTGGVDVPGFQSPQQARVIITDAKGDGDPNNDDVSRSVWPIAGPVSGARSSTSVM